MRTLVSDIKEVCFHGNDTYDFLQSLNPTPQLFRELVRYQFDTRGKLLRPLLVTLMSACCNQHLNGTTQFNFASDPLAHMYTSRKLGMFFL